MHSVMISDQFEQVIASLRGELDLVKAIKQVRIRADDPDNATDTTFEAFCAWKDKMLAISVRLFDLVSTIECWVMDQPGGSFETMGEMFGTDAEWERNEASINAVIAWQKQIKKVAMTLHDLDDVDVVDFDEETDLAVINFKTCEKALDALAAMPRKP